MKFVNPLVKYILNEEDFAIVNKNIDTTNLESATTNSLDGIRSSKISWSNDPEAVGLLSMLCFKANVDAGWNLQILGGEGLQYTTYNLNDYYDWHIDQGKPVDNSTRKISLTVFLNDPEEYEGGELELEIFGPLEKERSVKFKEPKGTVIFFPSDTWHKVNPVKSGVRKSLVTWFSGSPYV